MRRFFGLALLCLGLAVPANALDLSAMTEDERAAFGKAVREYLLENPQVIMEAVAVLEAREAEAQAEADRALVAQNIAALYDDGVSYVGGNPDGDVTVVEFLDYRCGFCRRAHPEVAQLLEFDPDVRLVIKEFPILGEQSVLASRFAVATRMVAGGDIYKQVGDALIAYGGEITMPALTRIAAGFDLDMDQIEGVMNSDDVTKELQANRALAQVLNISGTPTFVIGDELVRGYVPFSDMAQMVEDERG